MVQRSLEVLDELNSIENNPFSVVFSFGNICPFETTGAKACLQNSPQSEMRLPKTSNR